MEFDEQFIEDIPHLGIGGFLKKAFKSVKKAVKKIAPIVGGGIGFMLGGSAGAAIGSGIGGLIAGQKPEQALQTAMLGYGIGSLAGAGFSPLNKYAGQGIGGNFAFLKDKQDPFNLLAKVGGPKLPDTGGADLTNTEWLKSKKINADILTSGSKEANAAMDQLVTGQRLKDATKLAASTAKKSSLLGNALTAGSVASPFLTYYAAKKAEEDYVPTDPMGLNPLYYQDPQQFQVAGLGTKPYYMSDAQDYYGLPIEELPTDFIRQSAKGGIVQLADGSKKYFPRKTGPINGPGTGTSDDIPAMLSDGEFVFTSKAVRNAGGGNRRKGAKRMYQVMKNLEKGVREGRRGRA
tara:strand:+ start:413 stop:1459 length:1047 start_codon:yes stop_codon:yes gene_type:complete